MGDVQSTRRGSRQDAAAAEESREADHPQAEQDTERKTFKNTEQSSEISRKGEEVKTNGCREDEKGTQDFPLIATAPETQGNEEESQGEGDARDGVHLEITEVDVKQNDINSLGRFFSNIGLKLTINRGSGEKVGDDLKETNREESEETKTEKTEDQSEGEAALDSSDPTRPILTAVGSENVLEGAEKTAESREEPDLKVESEQQPHSTNPTGPGDVEIDSPIRRFFATGIFAGLWKKKEAGDETTEKELGEMWENEVPEATGQAAEEQPDEEPTAPAELRDETPGRSPQPDILGSEERDRVPVSPLHRFLSGSSLKRLSMKQRNIKSSEARLCDSGEDPAELLPAGPAEEQGNASAPPCAEAAKEDEGAWASFKRFMSPKAHMKKSSHSAEESHQPASAEEPREEPTSDHSPEEGKRRKNSSVSWEAVLCGSGRRRSRKTSDSEDEMPPIDLKYHKRDGKCKSGEESGAENEQEPSSPKPDGSPQEEDGGSTWKSLKRIVTPKRRSRDEDEAMKIKIQSDGEGAQENSSFSIKNLLPGRKKQRSEESQGRASSDEAEKDLASNDDDSETPGVVPLSEFEVDEDENESLEEKGKWELQQDQGSDVNLCLPQDFGEEAETKDTHEGPDDVTELAGKHQELSDIPEEGTITEPWATLASGAAETEGRDGTMVEVTSEAMTAPEPAADLTLQEETEMFTAASQFSSESATTSGNATPVPAERLIPETDGVLHQVAETFTTSPQATTPEPDQPFEGGGKEEPTILEMHRRSGAASTETGLDGEERPSAEEDAQDLTKDLAEALVSEGEQEIREAGDETPPLPEAHIGAEDAKQVQEPEIEGPAEGLGPSLETTVMDDNISTCLGTETGGEKPELETCLLPEVILEQQDAKGVEEPEDLQAEFASSSNRLEGSGSSPDPPMISENLARAETATGEADESAEAPQEPAGTILSDTKLQSLDSTETLQEEEVSQVQQSLESEEPETTSELNLTGETVPGEPKEELKLHSEITLEPKGPSEPGEAEVLKVLQQSLESEENEEEPSDNISGEETVPGEPRDETTVAGETSSDPVDESKTAEVVEEPETVETSSFMSEESNRSTLTAEKTSENIPKVEVDTAEIQVETVVVMVEASAEEPELSQVSTLESEDNSIHSAELEITSQIILTEETLPDEPGDERSAAAETRSEPVDDSKPAEAVEEPESVETSSLVRVERSISPHEPEETSENTESDEDENEAETMFHPLCLTKSEDAARVLKEPEELKSVLQAECQTLVEEETAAEASSENVLKAELDRDQHGTQTTLITEDTSEPPDDPQNGEGAELSPTVQPSSEETKKIHVSSLEAEEISENTLKEIILDPEDLEMVEERESEHPSMVKEVTCDHVSEEEPVPDEPEKEPILRDTNPESVDPPETVEEAEVSKMLHQPLESEESKEEPSDNISEEETVLGEPRDETTLAGEPEDDSKTDEAVEEPTQTVQTSSLASEESSRSTLKAEETSSQRVQSSSGQSEDTSVPSAEPETTSELIFTEETVPDEPKEELKLHSEITLDPEEPSESDGEAEVLKDEHPQSLESEESRAQSLAREVTSDNISEETTDKPREETSVAGETRSDPVDDSGAAEVVEEPETVHTSSLVREESSISPHEPEETSKNILKAGSDVDENKAETSLVTEEQPEFFQTGQSSAVDSEDTSVHSAEPEITSEITLIEESVPDEPGGETAAAGEAINGQETAEEVKELDTVQTSPQEYKSSSPAPEGEETSDISKGETVSDETKEEITFDPEDTGSADESEALTAANPTPESEDPSLAQEATCAHISGEEMVPGEAQEEPIYASMPVQEPELIQDVRTAFLDSGELEVKANDAAEAETDTVLLPEVCSKPEDAQEPEVLKTVEARNDTQVTPDNIPEAEEEEEDLTVETTTGGLKTEQVKDDRCSGTETETAEDEAPGAQHVDKCHSRDASEAEAATPSARDGVAEEVEEGKAEDTVEVAVVDAGTTSEGTTVDLVLEAEEMEEKDATDVCCRVVHAVESLRATTELEKEQILGEDQVTTEEEKVQVGAEGEEKESTTVQATEASHSLPVTKAKEVDQDEWMDAEENIHIQEETAGSFYKAEEPEGSQRGGEDMDQAGMEHEAGAAHASRSGGEGREEANKADEACGFESEEEDFEVALEHPGNTSAVVSLTG